MGSALLLAGPGATPRVPRSVPPPGPHRVPDSEALRRHALMVSWQRDREVAARRVRQRWIIWALLRVVLPLLLLTGMAITLELARPGTWQALLLHGEWPRWNDESHDRAVGVPTSTTAIGAASRGALPAVAAIPTPTAAPAASTDAAPAPAAALVVEPAPSAADSAQPPAIAPMAAGVADPAAHPAAMPSQPALGTSVAHRPALRFDFVEIPLSLPATPNNPNPGVTRP